MSDLEGVKLAPSGVWPDFVAPAKYDNPAEGLTDPRLPDFRLIWQVARDHGYAVGLHGSMRRDCDLIAVPWVEAHSTPEALISALCLALNASEVGPREPKPNGRIAVNLQIDGWYRLIDLSILSALSPSPVPAPLPGSGETLPRVDGKIAPPLEIGYTNYRGEFAVRCILPISFWYGSTEWHPEPQWLVKAYDADKGAVRDFAFKDFSPANPAETQSVEVGE